MLQEKKKSAKNENTYDFNKSARGVADPGKPLLVTPPSLVTLEQKVGNLHEIQRQTIELIMATSRMLTAATEELFGDETAKMAGGEKGQAHPAPEGKLPQLDEALHFAVTLSADITERQMQLAADLKSFIARIGIVSGLEAHKAVNKVYEPD